MDTIFLQNIFRKYSKFTEEEILTLKYNDIELLNLEKEKRGISKNKILFISANNFSKLLTNPKEAIKKIQENELDKFGAYFWDRIEYSLKLNLVNKFPKNNSELLKIGNELKIEDILKLKKIKNPNLDEKEKDKLIKKSKLISNPLIRGEIMEKLYAKKIKTIHFYKEYKNIIFTAEPDGIEENQVYEFKSHLNKFLADKYLESAKLQADIYGLCFNKNKKEIEQYIISWNKSRIFEEKINIKLINELINKYFK